MLCHQFDPDIRKLRLACSMSFGKPPVGRRYAWLHRAGSPFDACDISEFLAQPRARAGAPPLRPLVPRFECPLANLACLRSVVESPLMPAISHAAWGLANSGSLCGAPRVSTLMIAVRMGQQLLANWTKIFRPFKAVRAVYDSTTFTDDIRSVAKLRQNMVICAHPSSALANF